MKKFISLCSASLILIGCAGSYQTSTNLDKENFDEYFAASRVEIYESEHHLPKSHQLVGIVEGQSCQVKAHHAAPDKIMARTDARQKAYKQEANAIVFSQCAEIEDQQCHRLLICYGKAYQVSISEQAK